MKLVPTLLAVAAVPLAAAAAGNHPKQVAATRFWLSDGGPINVGFQELRGINSEVEPHQYIYNNSRGQTVHTKQFGREKPPTITLVRSYGGGQDALWTWHEAARMGKPDARKSLTLSLMATDGKPKLVYVLQNCFPKKLDIGGMKAGAHTAVMESVELACDSIAIQGGRGAP